MSTPAEITELARFDVCWCGDYRHQHTRNGCLICQGGRLPYDDCSGFRLVQKATEVPEFYRGKKP